MKKLLFAVILGLAMTAGAAEPKLVSGMPMPELKGEYLTGEKAVMPGAAHGKIALFALGFSYESRYPVEDWTKEFRKHYGSNPEAIFYEVPMIGGFGRLGRWFIDSGMRRATPKDLHGNVITVYGGTGPWRERLAVEDEKVAYLILLDPDGVVRWVHSGMFDASAFAGLKSEVDKLLDPRARSSGFGEPSLTIGDPAPQSVARGRLVGVQRFPFPVREHEYDGLGEWSGETLTLRRDDGRFAFRNQERDRWRYDRDVALLPGIANASDETRVLLRYLKSL